MQQLFITVSNQINAGSVSIRDWFKKHWIFPNFCPVYIGLHDLAQKLLYWWSAINFCPPKSLKIKRISQSNACFSSWEATFTINWALKTLYYQLCKWTQCFTLHSETSLIRYFAIWVSFWLLVQPHFFIWMLHLIKINC